MAQKPAETPVLLCPLRIETRFVDKELWIRVFPDDFLLESHNTHLTKEEIIAAKLFKKQISEEEKRNVWEKLVTQYGAYRAAYLVHLTDQEILKETLGASSRPSNEQTFCFRCLPEQLSFFLYKKNTTTPLKNAQGKIPTGKNIPDGLIAFGEGDEWLSDFDLAIEKGMGIKIPIGDIIEFEKIIVTGIQKSDSPKEGKEHLNRLIKNHQYHDGFSFIDYQTPTNNFEQLKSGASPSEEFDAGRNFESAVLGYENITNPTAAANVVSQALGLEFTSFQFIENAALTPPPFHALYQKATWFSMGANTLRMLFGNQISNEYSEHLWEYYSNNVFARGTYPTLKVGNQPYALLPVSTIRNNVSDETTFQTQLDKVLSSLFEKWMDIVRSDNQAVPRMESADDPFESLLNILAMQTGTSNLQLRTLTYDQVRGRMQTWLQNAADIPTALSRLPLTQVYELLEGQPETKGFLTDIKINYDSFRAVLPATFADAESTRQSPILSFKNDGVSPNLQKNKSLKFVQADLNAFNKILNQIVEENQTTLFQYPKEDLSVFVDLLLQSFTNATRLYHRVVYFQPSISDLKGFKQLRIGKTTVTANKNAAKDKVVLQIIASKTDALKVDKTINITAPFSGKIEKIYVAKGGTIEAGEPLFRIADNTKYKKMIKEMKSLAKAIITINNELPEIEKEQIQLTALRESFDLNAHRLDAWITGAAHQRINKSRAQSKNKTGILMGVYGWLENLKKDQLEEITASTLIDANRPTDGGIIHCPSPAQAMTATLFQNSFLSYLGKKEDGKLGDNPFALNLTSDRIQKSNALMQGVREDQSVEALLGYRLEKDLQEAELYEAIYILREIFPLEVNITNRSEETSDVGFTQLSVIDGLKTIEWKERKEGLSTPDNLTKELAKIYSSTQLLKIDSAIDNLIDTLDGSLDHLFFEAGYQLAQGNITRSAAAMDATKGDITPPETFALKTKLSGTGIQHALAILFPTPKTTFDINQTKAFVEPVLETWLEEQLGAMENIGCTVEVYNRKNYEADSTIPPLKTVAVKLSELQLGYLDFMFLPANEITNGASELEIRIKNQVNIFQNNTDENFIYKITQNAPANCQSLNDALEVKEYILALWNKSRVLKPADLSTNEETLQFDIPSLDLIKVRLEKIISKLVTYQSNPSVSLDALSQFNLPYAKQIWLYQETPNLEKLKKEIENKIKAANHSLSQYPILNEVNNEAFNHAFSLLEKTAKALFGKAFILLPPILASPKFTHVLQTDQQEKLLGSDKIQKAGIGGQRRVQQWVQELAQVQDEVAAFEDWQMVQTAWQETISNNKNTSFKIIQYPTFHSYPWVGLSKSEIDKVLSDYPANASKYRDPDTNEIFPIKEKGKYYPDGSASTVLYMPDDLVFSKEKPTPQYGMFITSFAEHIPDEKKTTGLSFHYNAPNCEAPQALLLAAASDKILKKGYWEVEDLNDILYDTLDLAKVRMVDSEALQKYGFILPMTWWFNIPTVN